ncbi:MAG: hypothetical protein Q8O11_01985, partial [Syntrophales bacterium]|nr:hypothetical protein [Syntrophales bacterium]
GFENSPQYVFGRLGLKEVVRRINLDPSQVDEVYYGTCIPAEYAIYTNVPARQITLLAGFPEENISLTIDRACCSSMTALRLGWRGRRNTWRACRPRRSRRCLPKQVTRSTT